MQGWHLLPMCDYTSNSMLKLCASLCVPDTYLTLSNRQACTWTESFSGALPLFILLAQASSVSCLSLHCLQLSARYHLSPLLHSEQGEMAAGQDKLVLQIEAALHR